MGNWIESSRASAGMNPDRADVPFCRHTSTIHVQRNQRIDVQSEGKGMGSIKNQ